VASFPPVSSGRPYTPPLLAHTEMKVLAFQTGRGKLRTQDLVTKEPNQACLAEDMRAII